MLNEALPFPTKQLLESNQIDTASYATSSFNTSLYTNLIAPPQIAYQTITFNNIGTTFGSIPNALFLQTPYKQLPETFPIVIPNTLQYEKTSKSIKWLTNTALQILVAGVYTYNISMRVGILETGSLCAFNMALSKKNNDINPALDDFYPNSKITSYIDSSSETNQLLMTTITHNAGDIVYLKVKLNPSILSTLTSYKLKINTFNYLCTKI
jgi:hypothetical protein